MPQDSCVLLNSAAAAAWELLLDRKLTDIWNFGMNVEFSKTTWQLQGALQV
jgi:hypothetical protein